MLFNKLDDVVVFLQRLCGLRVEVDIFFVAYFRILQFLKMFYDDGIPICLPHESQYLRMTVFSEDYDLRFRIFKILFPNSALQSEHHWACGINDLHIIPLCSGICLRWLAMSSQQHPNSMKVFEVVVVDGDQSSVMQSFTFRSVVYDIAETV